MYVIFRSLHTSQSPSHHHHHTITPSTIDFDITLFWSILTGCFHKFEYSYGGYDFSWLTYFLYFWSFWLFMAIFGCFWPIIHTKDSSKVVILMLNRNCKLRNRWKYGSYSVIKFFVESFEVLYSRFLLFLTIFGQFYPQKL